MSDKTNDKSGPPLSVDWEMVCTRIDALAVDRVSLDASLDTALSLIDLLICAPLMKKSGIVVLSNPGEASLRASLNLNADEQALLRAHSWRQDSCAGSVTASPYCRNCAGIEACLCLPLIDAKQRWQGVLCLFTDPKPGALQPPFEALAEIAACIAALISRDKLFRQNRRLRQIIEKNPASIAITDLQGRFEYVNDQFCLVTGYSRHEVIGQTPRILQSGETPLETYQALWNTITAGREWRGELKNRKKDGEFFWESQRIIPLFEEGEIVNYVAMKEDVSDRKYQQQQLFRLSTRDRLTNLPNEQLLRDRIEQALASVERNGQSRFLCLIDVKQMRLINESQGLATGDALLIEIARRLTRVFRKEDTIARLSGDAFALICATDEPQQVAAKLAGVCEQKFITPATEVDVDLSVAFIEFPRFGSNPETLLRRGIATLHQAKKSDGLLPLYYDETLDTRALQQISLTQELQQALSNNEFELWYQPKVNSATGTVIGAEALIRWRHPQRGIVSPIEFISLAEATGLIVEMGLWVIETVVAQVKQWSQAGVFERPVSFNVSPRQFADSRLVATIRDSIAKHQLDPALLEMELTESVLVDEPVGVRAILNEIAALGVSIALDDFGTGYSSLAYIHKLPINLVKIDKSFVQGVMDNQQDVVIVKSTLSMCRDLGLKVIAEGVETSAQCAFLSRNSCFGIQGYLFSKPLPADEFINLVGRGFSPLLLEKDNLKTVLALDDDQPVLNAIRRSLRHSGYKLLLTTDPQEAFAMLAAHDVGVVITDQRMPAMTGSEFLRRIKHSYPNTSRMVLSGYSEFDTITRAINDGAIFRYLSKPWSDEDLAASIEDGFYFYNLRKSLQEKEQHLDRIVKSSYLSLEGLKLGIGTIDQEHAGLVDLHNLLADAYYSNANRVDVLALYQRFSEHCQCHFDTEERLMVEMDYPAVQASQHKSEHERILKDVFNYDQQLQQDYDSVNLYAMIYFIQRCIADHIQEFDLAIADYFHTVP